MIYLHPIFIHHTVQSQCYNKHHTKDLHTTKDQPTYATQGLCCFKRLGMMVCSSSVHTVTQVSSYLTAPSNSTCLSSMFLSKVFDWVVVLILCHMCFHVLVLVSARIKTVPLTIHIIKCMLQYYHVTFSLSQHQHH